MFIKSVNSIVSKTAPQLINNRIAFEPLTSVEKKVLQEIFTTHNNKLSERPCFASLCLRGLIDVDITDKTGSLNELGIIMSPIDSTRYFQENPVIDIAQRKGIKSFNKQFFSSMHGMFSLFSAQELLNLEKWDRDFQYHKRKAGYAKTDAEMRLLLSEYAWKSCEIEGCFTATSVNRSSSAIPVHNQVPDTSDKAEERAISRELTDTTMVLNHKRALEFVHSLDHVQLLARSTIERLHAMLTSDLPCNYVGGMYPLPLYKEDLLKGLDLSLNLIKQQIDVYSQSVLSTVLLSYLQLFADGNKRTARLLGSAVMLNRSMCPPIYSAEDKTEYLDSLVLFSERNNLGAFKQLFMKTVQRSVEDYCKKD